MFWVSGSLLQGERLPEKHQHKICPTRSWFPQKFNLLWQSCSGQLFAPQKNARCHNGRWCIEQTCLFLQQHAQHPGSFFMGLHTGGEQVGGGFVVGFVHSGEQLAAGADHGFLAFH